MFKTTTQNLPVQYSNERIWYHFAKRSIIYIYTYILYTSNINNNKRIINLHEINWKKSIKFLMYFIFEMYILYGNVNIFYQ